MELLDHTDALAWRYRDRLSRPDLLRLWAQIGARYPEWTPPAEQIRFLDSALTLVPNNPELWYVYGLDLFIGGAHLGIPSWQQRAAAALQRAVGLDSTFLDPRNHLVRLAIETGDTAALKGLGEHFERSAFEASPMLLWLVAMARGDTLPQAARLRELAKYPEQELRRVIIESQSFGFGLADAEYAMNLLIQRSATAPERQRTLLLVRELASNRGRPTQAVHALQELRASSHDPAFRQERLRELIYYLLYWDGDRAAGNGAARELAQVARLPLRRDERKLAEQMRALCVLEQWKLERGERGTVRQSITLLRTAADRMTGPAERARTGACAALLEAIVAVAERRPDALHTIARFEAAHMAAMPDFRNEDIWFCSGNLVASRLRSQLHEYAGALAAVRRRGEPGDRKILLSSFLREEGHLALLTGDTTAALRAYQHFLVLQADPEPRLQPEVERIRTQVESLLSEVTARP
jgi:hypothetical protein